MKKILIPIAFLASLYCAAWYVYAGYVKHFLTAKTSQTFTELGLGAVENEGVSLSGFPMNIVVTIKNPKTTINSGEIFKKFAEDIKNKYAKAGLESDLPDLTNLKWNDQLSIDGTLVVSSNLLSTEYTIKRIGIIHYNSEINDQKFAFSTKGDDAVTKIVFNKSPLLTDYQYKEKDGYFLKQLFLSVAHFSTVHGKDTVNEDTSSEVLINSEGSNFSYDAEKIDASNSKYDLKIQTINAQISKKFSEIVGQIGSKIVGKENFSIHDYSRNGLMNSDIHLVYTGALDKDAIAKDNAVFDLKFVKFNYSDDLSKTSVEGGFNLVAAKNKPVSVNLKWKNTTQFDKKWYDYTIEDAKNLKLALNNGESEGEIGKIAGILRKFSATNSNDKTTSAINALLDNAEEITPKLHEWGLIKFDGDIAFDGKESGKISIKQLDFVTDLFGFKVSGDAEKSTPVPKANISLNFLNYSQLVDSLFGYIRKTLPFFEVATAKKFPYEIKDGFESALKGVMVELSETPQQSGADVVITLRADEATPMPMIGKLILPQAAMVAQSKLEPYLVPIVSGNTPENLNPNSGVAPSEPQASAPPIVDNNEPQIQQ